MSEFLQMGGYAAYVWPSYLLTFAIIVMNIASARRAAARAREEARRALIASGERP